MGLTPTASVAHYENFPVASLLMPRKYRAPVAAIYHFARSADDIADEGDLTDDMRLAQLKAYWSYLDVIARKEVPDHPLFCKLQKEINEWHLPLQPFYDLLQAFMQDIEVKGYATYPELLQYCRFSANPVGLLMLHLYDCATPENIELSNAICTGLQLVNFWQDVAIDWQKARVYLPQEDLQHFDVTQDDIANQKVNSSWQDLMAFQIKRTRLLLLKGLPLVRVLPGRFGWELRLIVMGGLRALEKIEQLDMDVFRKRAHLKPFDWAVMLTRACFLARFQVKLLRNVS